MGRDTRGVLSGSSLGVFQGELGGYQLQAFGVHRVSTVDRYPIVSAIGSNRDMPENKLFEQAFPYQQDVLALPVADLDRAAEWYGRAFGMREVERRVAPVPTVILERA